MLTDVFIHPRPVIRNCNADMVLIFTSGGAFSQFVTSNMWCSGEGSVVPMLLPKRLIQQPGQPRFRLR
jgi:hypothetical protein